jgi:hypothetical protein
VKNDIQYIIADSENIFNDGMALFQEYAKLLEHQSRFSAF